MTRLDGIGDNPYKYTDDAWSREFVENELQMAKEKARAAKRLRNAALINDFASGIINIIARKRGSRYLLPTDSAEEFKSYYLQAQDRLKEAQNDYNGMLAKEKIFTPPASSRNENVIGTGYLPVSKSIPLQTIKLSPPNGHNTEKPAGNWRKVVDKWRKEHLILPNRTSKK